MPFFSSKLEPVVAAPEHAPLRVFVYGTLKRGYYGFQEYCRGHCTLSPAAVRGRVVDRPEGYPTLFLPPQDVLAIGSDDPVRDAALPWRYAPVMIDEYPEIQAPWRLVLGELMEFNDPHKRLPLFDEFEEFLPGGMCAYCRVLAPVLMGRQVVAAWVYASPHSPRFAEEHK